MEDKKAKVLAEKHKNGACSSEELALLESWYKQLKISERIPSESQIQEDMDDVWSEINIERLPKRKKWMLYAAVSILTIGLLYIGFYNYRTNVAPQNYANDALPGRQQAVLTLATGQSIKLSEKQIGISFQDNIIRYADGSPMLEYTSLTSSSSLQTNYVFTNIWNTIEVPLGGNYKIVLSDGSTVWLNSGSKLRFPTTFSSTLSREVSLSGEAFFAVSKDPRHRFTVKIKDQQINVLGTKFNVESYPDQPVSKTTLLEGSVEIVNMNRGNDYGKKIILTPHEQTQINGHTLGKTKANTEKTIAWKDGLFVFNDDRLKDIMQVLSRWYQVDVDYNSLPENHFNGQISKHVKLSAVLEMLEITGNLSFKLENNVIKAYPKEK